MVLTNGPVAGNGKAQLTYTIENVKRDETLQSQDTVALPLGGALESVFFSENGVCNVKIMVYVLSSTSEKLTNIL